MYWKETNLATADVTSRSYKTADNPVSRQVLNRQLKMTQLKFKHKLTTLRVEMVNFVPGLDCGDFGKCVF